MTAAGVAGVAGVVVPRRGMEAERWVSREVEVVLGGALSDLTGAVGLNKNDTKFLSMNYQVFQRKTPPLDTTTPLAWDKMTMTSTKMAKMTSTKVPQPAKTIQAGPPTRQHTTVQHIPCASMQYGRRAVAKGDVTRVFFFVKNQKNLAAEWSRRWRSAVRSAEAAKARQTRSPFGRSPWLILVSWFSY